MIDLHTHSIHSDGSNTPTELVEMAEACGLSALALTDHDSVGGIPELMAAGQASSVETLAGIELSATCDRGTMHILGYFIDPQNERLKERISHIQTGREERNVGILKKLNKLGYRLLWEDIESQAGTDLIGRPHIASALVARGRVKSTKAAFELLLAKGRPGYVDRPRLSARECIELIHQAGGVAVLAHPATIYLPDPELRQRIAELKEMGLGGLEVYYAEYRPENRKKFLGWAKELDLVCTGGTDFHGDRTPDIRLGRGFGQLKVPDEVLQRLKEICPTS